MGRIADMLRDTGATTLDVDLRTGAVDDRSQYRNAVSVNGTPTWSSGERGWGMQFGSGMALTVGNSAAVQAPKTFVIQLSPGSGLAPSNFGRILTKLAGYELYFNANTSTLLLSVLSGGTRTVGANEFADIMIVCVDGLYVSNKSTRTFLATVPVASTNSLLIGNYPGLAIPFRGTIQRVALLNVSLGQTQAQSMLQELLTERIPTSVYSTQAWNTSGVTRRVVDDFDFSFAPVTMANVATANSEIPGIPGLRLISGSVKVTSNPKALGCTGVAALANYDARSRSKRFSLVWTDTTIDVGWTSVRGLGTATGQNGYWVQVTSGGQLRITKSLAGVETVLATDGTLVSGVEYDVHASWNSSTGLIQVWTRRTGQSDWTLACSATDTDVTSCDFNVMYMVGSSNKFTRRYTSINEASTPWTWG